MCSPSTSRPSLRYAATRSPHLHRTAHIFPHPLTLGPAYRSAVPPPAPRDSRPWDRSSEFRGGSEKTMDTPKNFEELLAVGEEEPHFDVTEQRERDAEEECVAVQDNPVPDARARLNGEVVHKERHQPVGQVNGR